MDTHGGSSGPARDAVQTDPDPRPRPTRALRARVDAHAIVMLDPTGAVVGWNSGAELIKGYRPAEVLGRSFEVFYPQEEVDAGWPSRHLAEAVSAGHVEYEGWRLRKDGSRFWADVVLTAIFDDDGSVRGFGKVTRDATARRNAEQALRDSEEHFRSLVASVRDYAIVMLDPHGQIVSWNAGAERITGYDADEVMGCPFGQFAPDEERVNGGPARQLAEAVRLGHLEFEGWRLRKDGSRFWATVVLTALRDHDGGLRGIGSVTRVTPHPTPPPPPPSQSTTDGLGPLRDSVLSHAIVMLDDSGRVTAWNAGAERITGYSADEVHGSPLSLFYLADEIERGQPARHLAEAELLGQVDYEGWRVRKDGTRFWADVVLTSVRDADGTVRGFGKVTRDATKRRSAEEALRRRREEIELLVASVRDHAIVMLDPTGAVVGWNSGAELIKGYRPAEVLGRSFEVFYPQEEVDAGWPSRHLAEAVSAGHVEYEGWRLRKDGSRFWADVVLTAIFDDDGSVRGFGKVTRDATARRNAEQALRDSEEHFLSLVASVRDYALVMLDPHGQIVSWNAGAERITGYDADEVLGCPFGQFAPDEERVDGGPARQLAEAVRLGHLEFEGWRLRKDGSRFWATVVLTALFDDTGELRGLRTVTRDVTERRRFEDELSHQALHDPLTGLGNRALLTEHLEHALARLPKPPGLLAVLFLDLDHFKLINDTLGHEAGDELLVMVAALLQQALRPHDLVTRLGGDEFVVVCQDLLGLAGLEALARRVTSELNVPVELRGREVMLSASVGVVAATRETTGSQLLRDADAAMYQAKALGRGRYALFDAEARQGLDDRLRLGTELHRALERHELRAHHQPLVDLRTGEVEAAEALLRWQHPDRGLLLPGSFLDISEELGLLVGFDAWIMRTACDDAVRQSERLGRVLGVWSNLSAHSLADPRLPAAVADVLSGSGLDAGLLTLEITEGALMRDAASTVGTLRTLRELGVHLAVDDFGTGYSSLSYLQQFPVDALKVDRSFVARLDAPGETTASAAIVRAVVSLARGLGLRTVAEGVETQAQLEAVTALGCDLGQGFLLARPGPAEGVVSSVPHPRPAAREDGAHQPDRAPELEYGPGRRP